MGLDAIKHGFRPAILALAASAACLGAALPAYGAPGDPAPAT
ncbi:cell envelope biogenesis protein OmpA, partial [Ralstonia solanacearum]